MSDNLVNDVKRLERVGNELSGTNQKLLAAVTRILNLIFEVVPEDINPNLGFDYTFSPAHAIEGGGKVSPSIYKPSTTTNGGGTQNYYTFRKGQTLPLTNAHVFAEDVARGFLAQLCKKLETYQTCSVNHLAALEQGEGLLRKKFFQ